AIGPGLRAPEVDGDAEARALAAREDDPGRRRERLPFRARAHDRRGALELAAVVVPEDERREEDLGLDVLGVLEEERNDRPLADLRLLLELDARLGRRLLGRLPELRQRVDQEIEVARGDAKPAAVASEREAREVEQELRRARRRCVSGACAPCTARAAARSRRAPHGRTRVAHAAERAGAAPPAV